MEGENDVEEKTEYLKKGGRRGYENGLGEEGYNRGETGYA